ncbi:MAG: ABC transporter ATP-binding protein [Spirochaetes bacterium]|nr:MAG: ABC transporter ATP-binding protein [Spirochaetota bacterium]
MKVDIVNLTKKFGGIIAVDSINLDIKDGEFVAFLGPSGCGKTTTLLMIAGIYKPTDGDILFDGKRVNNFPPKDRDIGMVFQSYALYPHMSVFQNLTYPLLIKKRPREEMKKEAQRVADMMGIGHLLKRRPGQLSGGQQQRVALGRALIKKPRLLLFDEPLSNLDARLRISMRGEIKKLQKDLGITSIYVTHDQIEALTMADRIAVIKDGVLQAYTDPEDLHDRPKTLFIAEFIGNPPMNLFDVEIKSEAGRVYANLGNGARLAIPESRKLKKLVEGKVKMGIRPQDIHAGSEDGISTEIALVEPMGRDDLIVSKVGNAEVHFLVDPIMKLRMGDRIKLRFDMEKSQFFDIKTELSLLWD